MSCIFDRNACNNLIGCFFFHLKYKTINEFANLNAHGRWEVMIERNKDGSLLFPVVLLIFSFCEREPRQKTKSVASLIFYVLAPFTFGTVVSNIFVKKANQSIWYICYQRNDYSACKNKEPKKIQISSPFSKDKFYSQTIKT